LNEATVVVGSKLEPRHTIIMQLPLNLTGDLQAFEKHDFVMGPLLEKRASSVI